MDTSNEEQVYFFDALDVSINTCPLNCISPDHFTFFDRFQYHTETGKYPEYGSCPAWYWRLHKLFSRYKKTLEAISVKQQ
jgi:hypothetical protein